MPLKKINPTKTEAWKTLNKHYSNLKKKHLQELFIEDKQRKENFTVSFEDFEVDFSRNRINKQTIENLVSLANEVDLSDAIEKLFKGDVINETENRAVLHTILRTKEEAVCEDNRKRFYKVQHTLSKIEQFSNSVIRGDWKGCSGKKITDIVNIGIGGSDLGPKMIVEALSNYKTHINTHFISNIDSDYLASFLKEINPETTLFIIVSKSFSTLETKLNAEFFKNWFLENTGHDCLKQNFVAVSTNDKACLEFGIPTENIFPMWNWVGGRFSLWSAVGLSISLSLGFNHFKSILEGANAMDEHFKDAPFEENLPVLLGLIGIWYNNFFKVDSEAVIPYSQFLNSFVPYLQQLSMESNGKSIDRNGQKVDYQTGTIVWGNIGTNSQHAFMQLVHQGTKLVPIDFIGFKKSLNGDVHMHKQFLANMYGQADALCYGKSKNKVHLDLKYNEKQDEINKVLPYKIFEGNKPSTIISIDKLNPEAVGKLVSLYEHKVFVQGIIWNIFSFDQFGVELGKEHSNKMIMNLV
ncbi:glucose-6-phosphate isomerase [Aureivirga marina]|uniref:glucose-6-phosphate isomerase n=1 Tax=Aureivirga marina TaxID=1182451 RepID=UPI0018C9CF03|nr:glucose-6-phosphate isomerase [Aureivirga marina]